MALLERISEDMKTAMKEKSEQALSTLRMLKSALKNKQIELMKELADDDIMAVIQTQVKQISEALDGAVKAGRTELEEHAKAELAVLKSYLPAELSDEELEAAVKEVFADLGETGRDMGKVMGLVMAKVKGRANGQKVRQKVEQILGKG